MVGEFGCLNALKTLNCDEEERMIFVSLLYKRLKTRGILSRPNLEGKFGPLDARSITPPKILNDVSRVPKRQKQQ